MRKLDFFALFFLMTLTSFLFSVDDSALSVAVNPIQLSVNNVLPESINSILAKKTKSEARGLKKLPQATIGYLDVLAQNSECRRFLDEINSVKDVLINKLLANKNLQGTKITLFVPSDQAMVDFGKVGLFHLPKERSKDPLKDSLLKFVGYHFILGGLSHKDLKDTRKRVKTVRGRDIIVGDVAPSVLYSVETPSAFIHVINKVLVDPELTRDVLAKYSSNQNQNDQKGGNKGLVTALDALEQFSICSRFLREFKSVKQDSLLAKQRLTGGDLTFFFPTDAVMMKIEKNVDMVRVTKQEDNELVKKFLNYHVAKGTITSSALKNSQKRVKTFLNKDLKLEELAKSVIYSIETDDGIVHVINKVLVDPELKSYFVN